MHLCGPDAETLSPCKLDLQCLWKYCLSRSCLKYTAINQLILQNHKYVYFTTCNPASSTTLLIWLSEDYPTPWIKSPSTQLPDPRKRFIWDEATDKRKSSQGPPHCFGSSWDTWAESCSIMLNPLKSHGKSPFYPGLSRNIP